MSIVLTVRPDVERAVIAEAERRGVSPQDLFDDILTRGLPPEEPDAAQDMTAALAALKNRHVPQSLDELRPRALPPPGMTAMQFIRGQWPGDESEEELLAALAADRAKDRGLAKDRRPT